MTQQQLITGPTFAEMLDPSKIRKDLREKALAVKAKDPLDPINLYNISWKDGSGRIYHEVLPRELTGVETPIVVLYGKDFPTGSHKVGATYSVLIEKAISGAVDPARHTIVWPSTGNYGIGGAWVGCRMKFDSVVILPEEMSKERFEIVRGYGARLELTPGCESNVKEIYDKCHALKVADPDRIRIMNQFEEFANYRFHYYVTGNTIVELAKVLETQGIGKGVVSAYISAMGSSGTIAAGDRLKQQWPGRHKIVGLEPIQCPTLYWNGYGGHDIQGIGDKHVTWIHNVMNMDAVMCIDDIESKLGLQMLTEEPGWEVLTRKYGRGLQRARGHQDGQVLRYGQRRPHRHRLHRRHRPLSLGHGRPHRVFRPNGPDRGRGPPGQHLPPPEARLDRRGHPPQPQPVAQSQVFHMGGAAGQDRRRAERPAR
jgi:cysteine synthase A